VAKGELEDVVCKDPKKISQTPSKTTAWLRRTGTSTTDVREKVRGTIQLHNPDVSIGSIIYLVVVLWLIPTWLWWEAFAFFDRVNDFFYFF
jgi:hypothetical protein